MSLLIYRVSEFETTHEREQFESLTAILKKEFDNHEDLHLLIANPSFDNRDIDAVFIKRDAITVIELKNYGGILNIAENGDWKCNNEIVKGGSNNKNPFLQVKINKTGLCSILNIWFPKPNVNLGHVSGIVLFNKAINIEASLISPQINTWFHVTDMSNIAKKLHNITSRSINYSNQDLIDLIDRLNLSNCLVYKTNISQEEIEKKKEEKLEIIIPNKLEKIKTDIESLGFKTINHFPIPERQGETENIASLHLSAETTSFLQSKVNGNIWKHQHEALKKYRNKENICLATSTSSGKSYVFYSAGIELLSKDATAKILAVYPLRALGNQQKENWENAFITSGMNHIKVGRIDGSVARDERKEILKTSTVLVITPDTIHTFLLGKLADNELGNIIKDFLKNIKLIILDEVHTFTGVFGSNSSYLYRRLNHAISVLQGFIPQFITASATIEDPETHLRKIVGIDFKIITNDSSPKKATDIILIEPLDFGQTLSNMHKLVSYFATKTEYKSITFLDSRKMVEQVAGGVNRELTREESKEIFKEFEELNADSIYPYRSGYEKKDSEEIQNRLMMGQLKGVVSTSALEMGIDIKDLDLGILLGIPYSSTSFYQRIGRVGRIGCKNDGLIIIVNDYSVRSKTIFKEPKRLFEIPMTESALYLDNENLQYMHALCFAEEKGEYDATCSNNEVFDTNIDFPESFLSICKEIRSKNTPKAYDEIKEKGGTYPQLTYPIRDLDFQFQVQEVNGGRTVGSKGTLSRSQVQREAYPGAIYYYGTKPFRVIKMDEKERTVSVRRERQYFTRPLQLPTSVFPQLRDEKIFYAARYGELKIFESELLVYEKIVGLMETRGGAKPIKITYPLDGDNLERVYYKSPEFIHRYWTTGTIITHPILDKPNVQSDFITQLIYEVFLLNIPFEKQDVNCAKNKFKANTMEFEEGSRFIAIYDQSYGSLRLTRRLTEFKELKKVFKLICELISDPDYIFSFVDNETINTETIEALSIMKECLNEECENISFKGNNTVCVIKPNSEGVYHDDKIRVIGVVSTEKGLKYRITVKITSGDITKIVPIEEVEQTENSQIGIYNFETYEVE